MNASPPRPDVDAVETVRPRLVLAICCLSLLMAQLDSTIVNVALPAIRLEFGASLASLQWIVDAYTLVVGSFLMLGGSLADRYGRRRVFQTGMALFTLGSLLCSVAPDMRWLIAARVVQALGGSMLNPVAMSIITHTFSDPKERAKAVGVWTAVAGISMGLGPLAGGFLTQTVGWRANFWVNLPFGLAAMLLSARYVPESRAARPRRADPAGQILVLTTLATLTWGVIEGPREGWHSPRIAGCFVVAALALGTLLLHEARRREPMLDLRFFRSAPFSCATLLAMSSICAYACFLFLNSLYLQEVRGFAPFTTGLCMFPMALAIMALSPLSGHLLNARGPRLPILACGVATMLGALVMTRLDAAMPLAVLLGMSVLFGAGFGLVNAPITTAAVSGMPIAQAALAAAVASTSRQIGAVLGVAIAGAITQAGMASGLDFAAATHPVWWVVAGLGAAIVALGIVASSPWAARTARRVAHLLVEPGQSDAPRESVPAADRRGAQP